VKIITCYAVRIEIASKNLIVKILNKPFDLKNALKNQCKNNKTKNFIFKHRNLFKTFSRQYKKCGLDLINLSAIEIVSKKQSIIQI